MNFVNKKIAFSFIIVLKPMNHDASHIKDYLERVSGKTVSITVTDNTTNMLTVKKMHRRAVCLRINHIFLDAEREVIDEIAGFLTTSTKTTTPLIRQYIKLNSSRLKKPQVKNTSIMTKGWHHDLREIYDVVNGTYFSGAIDAHITWGRGPARKRVQSRRFGSYNAVANLIRISPVLDRAIVPRYVVEYIVFHEMLHAHVGFREVNGKRKVHPPEFKKLERLHPNFHRANEFLKYKIT